MRIVGRFFAVLAPLSLFDASLSELVGSKKEEDDEQEGGDNLCPMMWLV